MAGAAKSHKSNKRSANGVAVPRIVRRVTQGPIAAAKAKAEFLGLIEQVSANGRPVIVTKRGKPLVQIAPLDIAPTQDPFGCMKGTVKVLGDIVGPEPDPWEAMA